MSAICPHCGAEISGRSSFCRECGSDASTGWSEDAEYSGVEPDVVMEDDDYNDFLAREFPEHAPAASRRGWGRMQLVLLVVLIVFGVIVLRLL